MIQYEEGRHRAAPRRIVKTKLANRDQFMTTEEVVGYLHEPSSLDLLTKILAPEDAIVSATDAAGALEMLRSNPAGYGYDMLISDLNMPTMDGLALIREVRQISPRLPIAIDTGYSSESSAIEAINLGVGGYLVKPFRAAEVMAVVARALSVPAA